MREEQRHSVVEANEKAHEKREALPMDYPFSSTTCGGSLPAIRSVLSRLSRSDRHAILLSPDTIPFPS
jgi:hypothetical protein